MAEFPRSKQVLLFTSGEQQYSVTIDWDFIRYLRVRAERNKGGKSSMGPITVKKVK